MLTNGERHALALNAIDELLNLIPVEFKKPLSSRPKLNGMPEEEFIARCKVILRDVYGVNKYFFGELLRRYENCLKETKKV